MLSPFDRPSPSRNQSYRDKDHSVSRRGGFERQSYERKPDRPYDHGHSMFGGIILKSLRIGIEN